MIERYSRPKMVKIWSQETRFKNMLEVEKAVAWAQAQLGMIPRKAALAIEENAKINVEKILEIEKTTKHDVIAFVQQVAQTVGEHGRFVHYGLTSSDVLDTAFSLQLRQSFEELKPGFLKVEKALRELINKNKKVLCAGRTHGMHAEPTTFGFKMAGFLAEFYRTVERVETAIESAMVGKISGAVGTYSAVGKDYDGIELEAKACKRLGLEPETIATQVVPRDRHAEIMYSLSLYGSFIERISIELRHLQRTELSEVIEGFQVGQKGSSAMPHKKNPISGENLTGIARLLRSYSIAASENVALWHERDISHSSVERVIFPDAFILVDYSLHRLADLLEGLKVDEERMLANMNSSLGQIFSSQLLNVLVASGMSREEAYVKVQSLAHGLKPKQTMLTVVLADPDINKRVKKKDLEEVFSGKLHQRFILPAIQRVLEQKLQWQIAKGSK